MFYWLLVAWFSDYLLLLLCVYASDECTCVSRLECLQSMVQVQNHTNTKLICLKTFFTPTEFSGRLHEVVEAALLCEGPLELTLVTVNIQTEL